MQVFRRFATVFWSLFLLTSTFVKASEIPDRPVPPRLVNDFTATLNSSQIKLLEEKLVRYNDTTSTQLVVVLVEDIGMQAAADYAYAIGEKWGVGQRGLNNGAVILVQPKTTKVRGQVFIAPGYGLEAAIPDALSKRIVENEMIPFFRQDDYYNGINNAIDVMISLAAGEFTADEYNKKHDATPAAWFVPLFILLLVFFMMRTSRSANHMGSKSSLPFWTAIWLASQASRSHSGSWKSFSGGSGFGGSGGGFGGFGGGSFGGGGAGGSW